MTAKKNDDKQRLIDSWNEAWQIDENRIEDCPPATRVNIFRHACMIGYTEKIEKFFPHVKDHIDSRAILVETAKSGKFSSVETLTALGFTKGDDMSAALVEAVTMRWPLIVRHLLDMGADPSVQNGIALDHAIENKDAEMMKILLGSCKFKPSVICDACIAAAKANNKDAVLTILDSGTIDIHFDDDRLLRQAAGHDRAIPDILELLVQKGANVHAQAGAALAAALGQSNIKNISALADWGADPALMTTADWNAIGSKPQNIQDLMEKTGAQREREAADFYKNMTIPDDLTRVVFGDRITGLMVAARAGRLNEAVESMLREKPKRAREVFSAATLGDRESFGLSFLDLAVRTGQHKAFFKPDLWKDRVPEMRDLCGQLPEILQKEILSGPVYEIAQKELAERNHEVLKTQAKKFRL